MKVTMKLEKAAKSGGGDKYAGKIEGEDVSFYVPQVVSRVTGTAAPMIEVNIEVRYT